MNDLLEELVGVLDDISMPEDLPLIERIDSDLACSGTAPLDE